MEEVTTDEQFRKHVAANVLRLLDDRGWSMRELGRRTGEAPTTISAVCAGKYETGGATLKRIAEALDVSMDRLSDPSPEPISRAG
jgi:transcriptional regulator with XRE-family HTH domain